MYFLTIEITRRRFASTIFVLASWPAFMARRSSEKVEMNSSPGIPNRASLRAIAARTVLRSSSRRFDGRWESRAVCLATRARYGR